MNAQNFNYKGYKDVVGNVSLGDQLSDFFLGTSNAQNQANMNMLNYQNQFNEHMANKQMDFQKEMSSTAYQRAIADMNKAGINPMVAFANGNISGASTPSGSAAHSGSAILKGDNMFNGWLGKNTAKALDNLASNTLHSREKMENLGKMFLGKLL